MSSKRNSHDMGNGTELAWSKLTELDLVIVLCATVTWSLVLEEGDTMRFLRMIKSAENPYLPPEAQMDASTKLRTGSYEGKPIVTDGPFIETKEKFGGCAMYEPDSHERRVAILRGSQRRRVDP